MINNIKTLEQLKDFINSSDSFGYNACDVVKDYANKNGLRVESEGSLYLCIRR